MARMTDVPTNTRTRGPPGILFTAQQQNKNSVRSATTKPDSSFLRERFEEVTHCSIGAFITGGFLETKLLITLTSCYACDGSLYVQDNVVTGCIKRTQSLHCKMNDDCCKECFFYKSRGLFLEWDQ